MPPRTCLLRYVGVQKCSSCISSPILQSRSNIYRQYGSKLASSSPLSPHGQRRGKKTKTTVKLSDLPQGALPSTPVPPLEEPADQPTYPTVVLQARQNMRKFDNCVLLTRVGGFYELYFEHAEDFGPPLNLKVASKKTSAGPVPMAGFPFFQLDRFLKILVQDMNRFVAIAEEFPNDAPDKIKSGGLMHDRRVARVITPGTLIDESFIDPYANNFIMAIHTAANAISLPHDSQAFAQQPSATDRNVMHAGDLVGLAWLDLSTGDFFTQSATTSSLSAIMSRVAPREVILDNELQTQTGNKVFDILAEDRKLVTYASSGGLNSVELWTPFLESEVPPNTKEAFTNEEILAVDLLLNYIKDRLQGLSLKLRPPLRYGSAQIMSIDKNTLRALEIKQTIRDGFYRGSLMHAIRRTVTKSGARLLSDWLSSPSTSLTVIKARQDLVAHFLKAEDLRELIIIKLRRSCDSRRLVQKFALGRGDPDDLLGLASTIYATRDITRLLSGDFAHASANRESDCINTMVGRLSLTEPLKLADCISESIDEDGLVQQHAAEDAHSNNMVALAQDAVISEGSPEDLEVLPKGKRKRPTSIRDFYAEDSDVWIMRPTASQTLQDLHENLALRLEEKSTLAETLRERLQATSLTLRWTPGLGHIAHIKGKDIKNLTDIRALSTSRSTRSFHLPEWTSLGQRIDQVRGRIRAEEQRVFQSLREQVIMNLVKLRRNASVLDELDVATSFSKLALEQNLVRPLLDDTTRHKIIGGRHPTVESGLFEHGRGFVRNDCLVGSPSNGSLWLITGPNMAGKSTFLRQNALITILAQVGCYVPASFAQTGIVDAIFSRVGSADDLYRDQSTFMVEMIETAQILRQATQRSFVIMDEIGRGTTPEDGTAVSFACLRHLVTVNQCRTLFATHFHAVADLATAEGLCHPDDGSVQMHCTDVEEDGRGGFVYVHKLRKGINRQSHALKVAKLAGMPTEAILTAQRIIPKLSEHGRIKPLSTQQAEAA